MNRLVRRISRRLRPFTIDGGYDCNFGTVGAGVEIEDLSPGSGVLELLRGAEDAHCSLELPSIPLGAYLLCFPREGVSQHVLLPRAVRDYEMVLRHNLCPTSLPK